MNTSTPFQLANTSASRIHPTVIAVMAVAAIAAVLLLLGAISALNTNSSAEQATPVPSQVDICSSNRPGVWFPHQVEQQFKVQCEEQAAP